MAASFKCLNQKRRRSIIAAYHILNVFWAFSAPSPFITCQRRIPALSGLLLVTALAASAAHAQEAHDHSAEPDHAEQPHEHGEESGHDEAGHAHGGHVHGMGHMEVSLRDLTLTATLTVPGGTFFGDLPEEQRTNAEAARIVTGPDILFVVPAEAACTLSGMALEVTEIEEGEHAGHTDITMRFSRRCDRPETLTRLSVASFAHMPKLEKVALTYRADGYALMAETTPEHPAISLASPLLSAD